MSLNQKQSAGKQKDGEQTPHYANICTRGSSYRLMIRDCPKGVVLRRWLRAPPYTQAISKCFHRLMSKMTAILLFLPKLSSQLLHQRVTFLSALRKSSLVRASSFLLSFLLPV